MSLYEIRAAADTSAVKALENKIHNKLADFGPDVVKALRKTGFFQGIEPTAADWARLYRLAVAKNEAVWPLVADLVGTDAFKEGAQASAAELVGARFMPDMDKLTRQYFERRGLQFVKDLSKTDKLRLKSLVSQYFNENETTFARALRGSYICDGDGTRLRRIKRTESHTANIHGSHSYAVDAGAVWKIWRTSGDDRVRPSHRAIAGQRRRINEQFSNGRMICDEVACRCWLEYEF